MKVVLHTLFFLLLAAQICFAQPVSQSVSQGGWFWQNPLPQGNGLNRVKFVSSEVGWAVGGGGIIIKTTNGGINWDIQSNQTGYTLHSVSFTDENNGCAVGLKCIVDTNWTGVDWNILGIILHTTNGGTTWTEQIIDTTWGELTDVFFTDANNGWVVGWELELESSRTLGLTLHTTNGGATWNKQSTGKLVLGNICFTDANNGWAFGYIDTFYTNSVILKTTDGGTNWTEQTNVIGISMGRGFFNDINNGWALGSIGNDGVIYRTTNGGTTWTHQTLGYKNHFSGVYFSDANNGWVVGFYTTPLVNFYGIILRTTNGGTTWVTQRSGIKGEIFLSVSSPDANNVSVVGGLNSISNITFNTIILRTTNGGTNWNSQTNGTTSTEFCDVVFADEKNGWAVGGEFQYNTGIILKTTDGGITWTEQTIGTNLIFRGVSFSDVNNGWVVGGNKIFHTNNGGTNWYLQTTLSQGYNLSDVTFIDEKNGWTTGNYGWCRTTDGGNNWMPMGGCPMVSNAIYFTDTNNGWAVGTAWDQSNSHGQICHTTNGGTDWTSTLTSGTKDALLSVFFTDANNGWAVGIERVDNIYVNITYGLILHTTNGGTTWTTTHTSGPRDELYSVFFTDANNGYVGGWVSSEPCSGLILHTTDGGISWTRQINGTVGNLESIYFTDESNGWAVGGISTILHTTNGGISFVEEEQISTIPTEFLLSHNYPNPFNPSTKIKYSVPQSSNVVIKVYDILGNEIETLINEEKPAGNYELNWNAVNLPSGVYFYQLRAGSFVETKKMILLK